MRKKALDLGKRFFKTELVSGSFYIMVAGTAGSFLAFLFNIFLTRKLSYADYGIFTALISFLGLVTIPSQAISTSIIQYATQYFSRKEIKKAAFLYVSSLRYMSFFSIAIFFVFVFSSGILANFLHITTISYLWLIALLVAFGYFGVVNNAFLQSILKFKFLAVLGFFTNFLKIVIGIGLIMLGFSVFGALGSVIIAGLLTSLVSFYPLRFLFSSEKEKVVLSKKDVFSYALSVSIISLSLTSFTSTDIILVKHFFSPQQAGLYSGLSLIGRVIFYFTAPIATVLFPLIIKKYHEKSEFMKTFYLALILVLVPSLSITLFYTLFPKFTITLFLGGKGYLTLIPYLGLYGLYLSVFSILNITITFLLSLKKISVIFPMVAGSLLQILLINFFHTNFFQVILSSLSITSILLVSILLYYVKNYDYKKVSKTISSVIDNTGL
jgi:O-antigen/teichoic acid export membrane protein